MESSLKYFMAISENKRKELELKGTELKIDNLKKKMLSQYWKDKISVFDEMIRLNVKTPSYDDERLAEDNNEHSEENKLSLGPMTIDAKLLSSKPITLQRGKSCSRVEPIINIEGTDAVCYPNKEAKRGRKVELNQRVLRRIEQCKALEDSIAAIRCKSASRRLGSALTRSSSVLTPRPQTAPKLSGKSKGTTSKTGSRDDLNGTDDRPSTSFGSFKREAYISTPLPHRPPSSKSRNDSPR
ncbi:hypothetical protein ACF0H5_002514 [Mactra antiquata]